MSRMGIVFSLIILGFILIFVGVVLSILGAIFSGNIVTSGGIIIFIGPFPIALAWGRYGLHILIVMILFTIMILLMVLVYKKILK